MNNNTTQLTSQATVLKAGRLTLTFDQQAWTLHDQVHDCMLLRSPTLAWFSPDLAGVAMTSLTYALTDTRDDQVVLQSNKQDWGQVTVSVKAIADADAFDISMQMDVTRDVRLASLQCLPPQTALNFFKLINYRNRHHCDQAWPELLLGGAGCQTDTASGDWQFAPHPTLMFLQRNDAYLSLGAIDLPRDSFGMHFQARNYLLDHWLVDYGGDEDGLSLAEGQTFTMPTFRLRYSEQPDAYAAYADFGWQLVKAGKCPDPAARVTSQQQWWLDPLYCTWVDQCMLASYQPAVELQTQANNCDHPTRSSLSQEMVRKAVKTIREYDLPFKTILLDEGWHQSRGDWHPHPDRFPEMRKLVDELHDQGFKVVIWWAWPEIEKAAESSIDPSLLMGAGKRNRHGCQMYDFSNPVVQENYFKPLFTMLFSDAPGCCNFDGIKTDFQADKIHTDMPLADPSWRGEENYLYQMHKLFYTTLKSIKPDAVHIGCAGHYWLAPYIDINRTYDVHGSNVQEHVCRAKMLQSTTFDAPVAFDFHNFLENLETYFDTARQMQCSVEVGNVLCTRENVLSESVPADASYLKRLSAKLAPVMAMLLMVLSMFAGSVQAQESGADLLPVFSRAHDGQPLRVSVLGGSITQAGKGWITDWLIEQFPKSNIMMNNAGMSATGSSLGIFRLQRDVIAAQPDLVFIEYAVNDGGTNDEDAIRYTESIVVRLKSLPHPPAIVFLQAAAKNGSKRYRHQQVAAHYGLFDIDLQVAVDNYLKETGQAWSAVMSDSVHPNKQGHALYSQVIARKLQPFVEQSRMHVSSAPITLPKPISDKPLILDGMMMPIPVQAGWKQTHSLPHWWSRFFNGAVVSDQVGAELTLSVRGSMVGLLFPLDSKIGGTFYASLDGQDPVLIDQSYRGGYSSRIFGKDLPACEHQLKIAVANPIHKDAGTVMMGYLLVAGHTNSKQQVTVFEPVNLSAMASRTFQPVPATRWQWAGMYGGSEETGDKATADLLTPFEPENKPKKITWKDYAGEGEIVNFAPLTGAKDRGVCYARTTISRQEAGQILMALKLDYFARIWINGQLTHTIDRSKHGGIAPTLPFLLPVNLKAGENEILIKVHAGSNGSMFGMYLQSE